jgi:hypothetical protein
MSQSVCNVKLVANCAREAWGAFYSPQENLAIGCQKPGHVRVGGRTCLATVSGTRLLSQTRLCGQIMLRGRTCLAWGPDMFDQSLWNPARGPDKSGLAGVFGGWIDF